MKIPSEGCWRDADGVVRRHATHNGDLFISKRTGKALPTIDQKRWLGANGITLEHSTFTKGVYAVEIERSTGDWTLKRQGRFELLVGRSYTATFRTVARGSLKEMLGALANG